MNRLRVSVIALVAASSVLLVGCEERTDQAMKEVAESSTSETTQETCTDPDLDLAETALGLWLPAKKIPTPQPKVHFSFDIVDNQFDPCATLSWVVLRGATVGMEEDSWLARESAMDTVLFFRGDQLITDMNFVLGYQIDEVAVEGDKATVTYEEPAYPRVSEGKKHTVTYTLAGETVKSDPATLPEEHSLELDFTKNPPAGWGLLLPQGNATKKVAEKEIDHDILAEVPMGDSRILCNFAQGRGVTCQDRTESTWPVNVSEFTPSEEVQTAPNGKTNFAKIDFAPPPIFRTSYSEAGNISAEETLPDESVTKVAGIYVDTRGETVKLSDNLVVIELGKGVAEKRNEAMFELDSSRHPKGLKDWDQ